MILVLAVTLIVFSKTSNPIELTTTVCCPSGNPVNLKIPSTLVPVDNLVPFMVTPAKGIGRFVSSKTRPVSVPVCANVISETNNIHKVAPYLSK
ncbi:hypothetical protein D3C80_978580 [compost metagenome]